ncbi:MAG TPA: hypothetical protein VGK73_23690 [Polyangiaceae bacterium]
MASFLVTDKMSPEFRARLQANISGKRVTPGARLAPRSLSWLRVSAFLIVVGSVAALVVAIQRHRAEREAARSELLARVQREASALTSEDRRTPERVKTWLERVSGPYTGDTIGNDVRGEAAFAATLARPMIYVRGPLGSFRSAAGIAESADSSQKDALISCLMEPPASRSEKALLARARTAFGRADRLQDPTEHVERLRDALAGIPLLTPAWEARVREAPDMRELGRLTRDLERAPLRAAKRAAKAELLLYVLDEPATSPGPVELDGERAHDVRVGLVELRTQKLLFQLRRPVDPSFISPNLRSEYAGAIDSCALSLDVREAVTGRAPSKG